MTALPIETLEERIAQSELGQIWILDSLMLEDIWPATALGYTPDECRMIGYQNFHFNRISLPWLKLLTKLTVKARVRARYGLATVEQTVTCLSCFDTFLVNQGYIKPTSLTDTVVNTFIQESEAKQSSMSYATQLWAEEGWLKLSFTPFKYKRSRPKIEIIPEEVLHQIYEHLDLFPEPLERLFRLQIALGCRLNEMLTFPRHCLKKEGENWFLLRWIAKCKHWRHYQIHPLVAELVQEQQKFINNQFGINSDFDKLFSNVLTQYSNVSRFNSKPIYEPSCLSLHMMHDWLSAFREEADLRDKHGNRFPLTSHMFRRTKASVMAYCEVEDEYIAAVLGHGSLDMLPHYRKRSIERLEKESKTKGYVDMYGRITTHKPRKQRYEKLSELLKVSTPLGECHRPTMLGDCQARYACLSCQHHRVTETDLPKLEADRNLLEKELHESQLAGQQRRVTEIERLLKLVNSRLKGLDELQTIKEVNHG